MAGLGDLTPDAQPAADHQQAFQDRPRAPDAAHRGPRHTDHHDHRRVSRNALQAGSVVGPRGRICCRNTRWGRDHSRTAARRAAVDRFARSARAKLPEVSDNRVGFVCCHKSLTVSLIPVRHYRPHGRWNPKTNLGS